MKTRKKVSVEETDNCYLHISISINPFFLITAYIKGQGNGPNKNPAFSNNPVGMCGFITNLAIETLVEFLRKLLKHKIQLKLYIFAFFFPLLILF